MIQVVTVGKTLFYYTACLETKTGYYLEKEVVVKNLVTYRNLIKDYSHRVERLDLAGHTSG